MKKIIANFLLLIFCSIPRLLKAQIGTDKFSVTNEEKISHPRFIENISFIPSAEEPLPSFTAAVVSTDVLPAEDISLKDNIEGLSLQQVKYAMMLDVAVETITNTKLYKFIENWYGIHYRLGGTTKKGIDCSAFTDSLLAQVYNVLLPRTARQQYQVCQLISREDLVEGDLVFFNTTGGISHVGVYLDNDRFVHSSKSQGVVISNLADNYFTKRYIGGGRVQNNRWHNFRIPCTIRSNVISPSIMDTNVE